MMPRAGALRSRSCTSSSPPDRAPRPTPGGDGGPVCTSGPPLACGALRRSARAKRPGLWALTRGSSRASLCSAVWQCLSPAGAMRWGKPTPKPFRSRDHASTSCWKVGCRTQLRSSRRSLLSHCASSGGGEWTYGVSDVCSYSLRCCLLYSLRTAHVLSQMGFTGGPVGGRSNAVANGRRGETGYRLYALGRGRRRAPSAATQGMPPGPNGIVRIGGPRSGAQRFHPGARSTNAQSSPNELMHTGAFEPRTKRRRDRPLTYAKAPSLDAHCTG